MKKYYFKRILSTILSLSMVLCLFPMTSVSAASYNINGHNVSLTSVPWIGNGQCWEYANRIYNIIWGQRFSSSFSTSDNMLRNLSDSELEFTKEHARAYISQASVGAVIRISNIDYLHANSEYSGHNFVIVQKDNNGFTALESISAAPDGRRERYWTYDFKQQHIFKRKLEIQIYQIYKMARSFAIQRGTYS